VKSLELFKSSFQGTKTCHSTHQFLIDFDIGDINRLIIGTGIVISPSPNLRGWIAGAGAVVEDVEDEFDTTIAGPWMDRWDMTHQNRHTAAHLAAVKAGKGSESWTFA
jgi:hypothetical protein